MIERAIVVFLDGVGLGEDDPHINPLAGTPLPTLQAALGGARPVLAYHGLSTPRASLLGLDAGLGVPGLPQSGTGQTALLTGINAAALLGQHEGPYPSPRLYNLLNGSSLFRRIVDSGRSAVFANAYTERFLGRVQRGTQRLSANARAAWQAGLTLRGPAELKAGQAVSALLTNDYFRQAGYDVPQVSAEEAGATLAGLSQDQALSYFEFWYSDVAGHRCDPDLAAHVLGMLDQFLGGLLAALDDQRTLLLVVSDHGNLEDLRSAQHTRNPALAVLMGADHERLAAQLHSLTDVAPALLSALNVQYNGSTQEQ